MNKAVIEHKRDSTDGFPVAGGPVALVLLLFHLLSVGVGICAGILFLIFQVIFIFVVIDLLQLLFLLRVIVIVKVCSRCLCLPRGSLLHRSLPPLSLGTLSLFLRFLDPFLGRLRLLSGDAGRHRHASNLEVFCGTSIKVDPINCKQSLLDGGGLRDNLCPLFSDMWRPSFQY